MFLKAAEHGYSFTSKLRPHYSPHVIYMEILGRVEQTSQTRPVRACRWRLGWSWTLEIRLLSPGSDGWAEGERRGLEPDHRYQVGRCTGVSISRPTEMHPLSLGGGAGRGWRGSDKRSREGLARRRSVAVVPLP